MESKEDARKAFLAENGLCGKDRFFCGHAKNAQEKRTIIIRGSPFWIERAFQRSDFLKKCEEKGEKRFLFVFFDGKEGYDKQGKKKIFFL